MRPIERLCVYCGSSLGTDPVFAEAAAALGELIVAEGLTLVYGGASVGLMGVLADTVLAAGGEVIGVIPSWLVESEIAHPGLSELHVVETMQERKRLMAELSDAFVALPGGFGTLEELFEAVTASQVGLHTKPTGLLEVGDFFDSLLAFLDHAVAVGVLRAENRRLLLTASSPRALLDRLRSWPGRVDQLTPGTPGRRG
ncbi:TIGR00730 family Rossman fold protein [Rhabdothermincola sp.]|mgnify:FL=1|uniref:LOG family protein n=1 Tax=Rhabdothermincola sp. TaxID=2820405 RepID=UPI002FE20825